MSPGVQETVIWAVMVLVPVMCTLTWLAGHACCAACR
jgi:hypothetical protein